ncbi:hypothetical protein [Nocardiopsis sp. CNS-639]|uniref:hypothetical protein n=1 Tax=Nocardiopsis sp. CNS-639 TaxID=1169153 RepID=UPI0003A9AC5A|nr:hypothetical protein [Nocardiopsis sp. CNS-639]
MAARTGSGLRRVVGGGEPTEPVPVPGDERDGGPLAAEPAIGVSNFAPEHLERLIDQTDVVPALNQSELHPYFTQPDVQRADAAHGVLTQA